MDFEELVYGNTTYLRDNGFTLYSGSRNSLYTCHFKIIKYNINDTQIYFRWNDVCDDLEPLLFLIRNKGLLFALSIFTTGDMIKYKYTDKYDLEKFLPTLYNKDITDINIKIYKV